MNFISTFDELNKLYEDDTAKKVYRPRRRIQENFKNEQGSLAWNKKSIMSYTQAAKELGLTDFDMKAVSVGGGKQKAVITAKKNGKQISTEADYLDTIEDINNAADAKGFLEYIFGGLSESVESEEEVLTEAAEDEEEIEIVDDEEAPVEEPVEEPVEDDEPRQVIMECSKCGALVIKAEADVVTDEESALVNVEDECAFCEEAAGYTIVGVVAPYETAVVEVPVDEPIEEPSEFLAEEEPVETEV